MRSALASEVKFREVWAWSMYDFANSAYTTVVITAVFGAYFVAGVAGNATWATFAWTAALSISYAAILFTGPLVGAWADAHAAKKRLLFISTVGCVVFTAALAFVKPGDVLLALMLVALSNYFFGTGENLIAAFLPELADSQAMGRVSGWGWSFGYLGGLLALGLCLAYIMASGRPAAESVPVTMLITAVFFAVAATPTFIFLRERAVFTTQQTITLILVVNVTAAIGAFGFGYLQDAIGHVRSLALTLVGWIVMVLIAGFSHSSFSFWIAANLAGLCMGSSQAAGRAVVGYLAPPTRLAEFFGLWGLAVKAASIFGPLTYGAVTWIFAGNHRLGIFATGVYFVIGLVLLLGIDVERGRRAALARA